MSRRNARAIALSVAAILCGGAAPAWAQTPDLAARVDAVFEAWADPAKPGCAVAAEVDGRPVISRAYGAANLELGVPASDGTVYEAGSVSKQFTAAAIVLLAQDGRLSLDDDVRRHVPELPDYGQTITLRHLLTHTSGLRDWGAVAELEGWPRGTRAVTHDHVLEIIARQRSLNHAPGAEYIYSNSNYNLLAIIVERITGGSLGAFTRARLFEPLGMTHTGWRDDHRAIVAGRATAYARSSAGWRTEMPFEDAHGNGGLLTTVGDLLIWNRALSNGRLGEAFMAEMLRPGVIEGGRPITYASGLMVQTWAGRNEVAHSGATGGYRAWLGRYPDQRVSVALLCNAGDVSPVVVGRSVADLLLPPAAPVAHYQPASTPDGGLFVNSRTGEPLRLIRSDARLATVSGSALTPVVAGRWRLGGDELVFDGPDGFDRLTPEGDRIPWRRMEAAAPDPAALQAYVGRWISDEVPAIFETRIEAGTLQLFQNPASTSPLQPAYADAFTSTRGIVRFERDAAGRLVALRIGNGRVRDMVFRRAD